MKKSLWNSTIPKKGENKEYDKFCSILSAFVSKLTPEEIEKIQRESKETPPEIKRLKDMFDQRNTIVG